MDGTKLGQRPYQPLLLDQFIVMEFVDGITLSKERDSFLFFLKTRPGDHLCIPDEPKFQALLKKYGFGHT